MKTPEIIDKETLFNIKEIINRKNNLTSTLGQISIERYELNEKLNNIYEIEQETFSALNKANKEMENILNKFREKYPDGVINIENGMIFRK
jgi:flagellar biosynthesis/type III secretory pathway chaperone